MIEAQDTLPQCNIPPRKGLRPLQTADTPHDRTSEELVVLVYSSHAFVSSTIQRPNAGAHLLPKAGATQGADAVGSQVQCFVGRLFAASSHTRRTSHLLR